MDRDLPRRTSQIRKMHISSVCLDLPPDLAAAINLVAVKAGLEPSALIVDVLRDFFGSTIDSAGTLAVQSSEDKAA